MTDQDQAADAHARNYVGLYEKALAHTSFLAGCAHRDESVSVVTNALAWISNKALSIKGAKAAADEALAKFKGASRE